MTIKFALPTGDARAAVGEMLDRAGIAAPGYEASSRILRSEVHDEGFVLRIFREKDIPIQVALGNYDLGICGEVWLQEMQVRFPLQRIVRIGALPGPKTEVWLAGAEATGFKPDQFPSGASLAGARIVSELPNLADALAVQMRIPGYRLQPIHGSAEAYPPEDADLVVVPVSAEAAIRDRGLLPLHRFFVGGLALIANADALATKNLAGLLARLAPFLTAADPVSIPPPAGSAVTLSTGTRGLDVVRLAVPDGHAQRHAPASLLAAGLQFDGYDEKAFVRRPNSRVEGLSVKVVRPQDMPAMVALGMFDIGISGRDLLHEHLCKFPASPVFMAADLGTNRYRIGPVVDEKFPAYTTEGAIAIWNDLGRAVRIASEFPATAERFARDHRIAHSVIIPVAGASEGFVPEDADFLIEGTETGTSIRANGLKMLDPFMESTACVIARREPVTTRRDLLEDLLRRFEAAAIAART